MKKSIVLLLVLAMLLTMSACTKDEPVASTPTNAPPSTSTDPTDPGHTHSYTQTVTDPDCTNAGFTTHTCECGDTYKTDEVAAPGHTWVDATCAAPKTCSVCAVTEGEVADHNYQGGTCSVCSAKDPNFKALTSGKWLRTTIVNDQLMEQKLCFTNSDDMGPAWSVRYFENIGPEVDPDFMDYLITEGKLVQIDGNYYQHMGMGDMGEVSFAENGSTITVTLLYWDSSIVLERISGNQLKVTAVNGYATMAIGSLKVGDIFTWSK